MVAIAILLYDYFNFDFVIWVTNLFPSPRKLPWKWLFFSQHFISEIFTNKKMIEILILVYLFPIAAAANLHKLSDLTRDRLFSYSSGVQKPETKVSAGLHSFGGSMSLPFQLSETTFTPRLLLPSLHHFHILLPSFHLLLLTMILLLLTIMTLVVISVPPK